MLEHKVERLDDLNLAGELLHLELLSGHGSHLALGGSEGLAELFLADVINLDEVGNGEFDRLLAILELGVHVEYSGVGLGGVGDHTVAL